MNRLAACFAIAAIVQAATANADEFANVDPVKLAISIEQLAKAWSIETVVAENATDDFADGDIFQAKEPEKVSALTGSGGDHDAKLERALLNLGTGKEDSFAIRRIGRQ